MCVRTHQQLKKISTWGVNISLESFSSQEEHNSTVWWSVQHLVRNCSSLNSNQLNEARNFELDLCSISIYKQQISLTKCRRATDQCVFSPHNHFRSWLLLSHHLSSWHWHQNCKQTADMWKKCVFCLNC